MFQDHALFPHRDVAANVGFGLRMQGLDGPTRRIRAAEMLELVGLSGFEDRPIDTLSGGEAQRVALARALAPHPRVLLLDEPFGSLDRRLRDRLVEEIPPILRAADVAAVHVTHDHDEAFAVADRVGIMIAGRIDRTGPAREVWTDPQHASVARFLGHTNLVEVGPGGSVPWGTLPLEPGLHVVRADAFTNVGADGGGDLVAVVERSVFAGGRARITVRSDPGGHHLTADLAERRAATLTPGTTVRLGIDPTKTARVVPD
jgi:thiamine transport system ATP-binding protein